LLPELRISFLIAELVRSYARQVNSSAKQGWMQQLQIGRGPEAFSLIDRL
jgi:hypothetical protein